MKKEAEERKFHTVAKVHDLLEMWQGSQNLCDSQKESQSQNGQKTDVGYTSVTEAIFKPPGHSFNIMVRLLLNYQKDHLCHQLCLQRTSLEDEL